MFRFSSIRSYSPTKYSSADPTNGHTSQSTFLWDSEALAAAMLQVIHIIALIEHDAVGCIPFHASKGGTPKRASCRIDNRENKSRRQETFGTLTGLSWETKVGYGKPLLDHAGPRTNPTHADEKCPDNSHWHEGSLRKSQHIR